MTYNLRHAKPTDTTMKDAITQIKDRDPERAQRLPRVVGTIMPQRAQPIAVPVHPTPIGEHARRACLLGEAVVRLAAELDYGDEPVRDLFRAELAHRLATEGAGYPSLAPLTQAVLRHMHGQDTAGREVAP